MHWDLIFSRLPNDRKEETICELLLLLSSMCVDHDDDGQMYWLTDNKGCFSVKNLCTLIDEIEGSSFTFEILWKTNSS